MMSDYTVKIGDYGIADDLFKVSIHILFINCIHF